ncbi:MAG: peptide-methionine (S)-S-oxide reductase MsrA [Stagnimonas sp.]|nr:peptide-methionine (S)-S-oxide reductase MsrA [Stagnimonas sp.]
MTESTLQKATFAAGCFWSVEYKFSKQAGVVSATSGYEGGFLESPTYKQVCTDRTGHAEVVQLDFDPAVTSYETLLRYFFTMHEPTTRNRQGPDIGTQYRSAIFFHSAEQQQIAQRVLAELNASTFGGKIVTEVLPAATFWRAEEYHQRYNEKHPEMACAI